MVRFVTIKKFCELTGYTAAGVYTRKCKGIWPEGSVWRYEPGTKKILMDLDNFDRWVEAGETSIISRVERVGSPLPPRLDGEELSPSKRRKGVLRPVFDK